MESLLGNPMFVIFAFLTITSVAHTIGHYWTKYQRITMDASLKHEMIQRGMSADDIEKVLAASSAKKSESADEPAEESVANHANSP